MSTILIEKNVMVSMRDGAKLATDVYRLEGASPTPVLIVRTPYNKDGLAGGSSATMAYHSSLVYLVVALILAPLAIVIGEIPDAHPSIAFLFRAWAMPTLLDWIIMSGLGLVWAGWMYFMSRAYSLAQASVIAPFEYVSLPINVMWGLVIWQEIPTLGTLAGAFLTLLSGMYILYRERSERPVEVAYSSESSG